MEKLSSLSFLIPTFNDELTIATAVAEANVIGKQVAKKFDIYVINDGSVDSTAEILTSLQRRFTNLTVEYHEVNKGYGITIKELYNKGTGEWLFTIPGDFQITASQIFKLLPFIKTHDLIIGWRKHRKDPASRLLQSAMYNILLKHLHHVMLHDVNSVKLIRRKVIDHIDLLNDSAFVDAELVIKGIKNKFRVTEVPIAHRVSVKTGRGGSIFTIFPTILDMIQFKNDAST